VEKLLAGLKEAFYSSAGGTGANAASIGISMGSYYSSDKGRLIIDSDALQKALAENPDKVLSIFTGGSSSADSASQGVIYKIINSISEYRGQDRLDRRYHRQARGKARRDGGKIL
jgi:flagellar capping protein FliD